MEPRVNAAIMKQEQQDAEDLKRLKEMLPPKEEPKQDGENYAQLYLDGKVPFNSIEILNSLSFAQVLELIQKIHQAKQETNENN